MTNPLTAVFVISAYMPFDGLPDGLGIDHAEARDTQLLRVTFKTPEDRAAFPARVKIAMEQAGGELIICEEVEARYDSDLDGEECTHQPEYIRRGEQNNWCGKCGSFPLPKDE